MDTSLAVKNLRRQSWSLMLQNQAESGLTIREWCRQNGISLKCFYYRRRQGQAMLLGSVQPSAFAELVMPEAENAEPEEHVQTAPVRSGFMPQLTISIGDIVIGVDRDTPEDLVGQVLRTIRNA